MTLLPAPTPLLALTQGDPSGIGPDIALAAYVKFASLKYAPKYAPEDAPPFALFGDPDFLRARAKMLDCAVAIAPCTLEEAVKIFPQALPVIPLQHRVAGDPGRPSPQDAAATIESIERATQAAAVGAVHAVVTNPIAKSVLYEAGFAHPGHTEFLGALAQRHFGRAFRPAMMIWSPDLAVVPATIHVSLRSACDLISRTSLVELGRVVAQNLQDLFGLSAPRLAFSGLNPHAGENGALGREEIEIIAPAVQDLRTAGILAFGPLSADTMFCPRARITYDVAICMTHDQALIPVKTLSFDEGVNVTLGLPFLRTSPDHGTAFDIAGSGQANPSSLIAALKLAARLQRPALRS